MPTQDQPEPKVVNKNAPELILVNKKVRLTREYEPSDLTKARGVTLRAPAALALDKMLSAAGEAGIGDIRAVSGYRSYATQDAVHSAKIERLRPEYKDGAELEAEKLVAPPGASEHQTGLAVDLSIASYMERDYVLNYDFADTKAGRWLKENSWRYGFVLRYAEEKEAQTGFSYEPWHYRYVGAEHAQSMYEAKVCLEEYLAEK